MKQEKIELLGKRFPIETEAIAITGKKIQSIPDLTSFKKLKRLDLSRNEITQIEGLDSLYQLEELNLDNNLITKIENVSGLTRLKSLSLSSNQIETIENLDNLLKLESLQLSSNHIRKISGLSSLVALRFLYLINNQIDQIEQIENLENLEELFLGENKIRQISGLKGSKKLWKVYLNDNRIENLFLDNLPVTINILNLAGNVITKLDKPGIKLDDLNMLSLMGNPLSTLKYIENLPNIGTLSIEGKKCKAISLKTYIHLKERYAKESEDEPFCFLTAKTTSRRDIDEFITSQKIEVVD